MLLGRLTDKTVLMFLTSGTTIHYMAARFKQNVFTSSIPKASSVVSFFWETTPPSGPRREGQNLISVTLAPVWDDDGHLFLFAAIADHKLFPLFHQVREMGKVGLKFADRDILHKPLTSHDDGNDSIS
jgi:hypothetical protein